TNHFLGNHPPFASVDASTGGVWTPILKKSRLKPGSQHFFKVASIKRWTHLRLNIFPDGGVARLRAYGVALPEFKRRQKLDLASVLNGGCVAACNDAFFGPKDNLIMPGRAKNMGDGWETKRKRVKGHDWVVVRFGSPGRIDKIELDTNHFKGNYPDRASLEGILSGQKSDSRGKIPKGRWTPVLAETKLKAHTRHYFTRALLAKGPFDYLRMRIFPDGGISRMRVWGNVL
ncbi:MAG: allantoicase, partial [Elusimicrobia bacterium]